MVTIQPFEYEKTTAFKERVQIANKVNEIISLFNELDIESKINIFNEEIVIINGKITEINNALNEVNTAVTTVEGYDTRLTANENLSSDNKTRLDNLTPRVSATEDKNTEQDSKLSRIENLTFTFNSTKTFKDRLVKAGIIESGTELNKWYKVATMPKQSGAVSRAMLFSIDACSYASVNEIYGLGIMNYGATTAIPYSSWLIKRGSDSKKVLMGIGSNGELWEIWLKCVVSNHRTTLSVIDLNSEVMGQLYALTPIARADLVGVDEITSDTNIAYIDG